MKLASILAILSVVTGTIASPVSEKSMDEIAAAVAAKYGFELEESSPDLGSPLEKRGDMHCWRNGVKFGDNKEYALDRAGLWCRNTGHGPYRIGEAKNGCYNWKDRQNLHFTFFIQNRRDRTMELSSGACFNVLREAINCERGGEREHNWWKWRADPNNGRC